MMKFHLLYFHFLFLFLSAMALISSCRSLPRTDYPILPGHHFMFMWNAPTELCNIHFGMPLDLSYFSFVSSTLKTMTNQSISIFYIDRFGIFPYIDEDTGEMHDEGLPQMIDMQDHRDDAADDIKHYIPTDGPDLAVLDFEECRPQWIRNWGSKDIYREVSIEKVKKKNASLSEDEAEERVKILFERAAKRPKRLWDYYLYPYCYNYDYNQDMVGFAGECPDIEKQRNDNLLWLWKESTLVLKDSRKARLFVRHRIQEVMRVSTLPQSTYSIPIYAYIRPVYKDSVNDYMSEFDLVNTIGEAAALGAAGVVSWGDMNVTDTEDSCFDAQHHLEQVMNRYIVNVCTATRLCSDALCQGQGRCIRNHWDDDVFLHLDSHCYRIKEQHRGGPFTVSGGLSQDDINWFDKNFDCMCCTEMPCRSVITLNVIHDAVINTRNRAADRTHSILHVHLYLCVLVWVFVSE
uniref:Hyaluronidase n=1 Tax=Oreochromis aureus TaxID=47969 RepID=A0A668SGJ7_OREAU